MSRGKEPSLQATIAIYFRATPREEQMLLDLTRKLERKKSDLLRMLIRNAYAEHFTQLRKQTLQEAYEAAGREAINRKIEALKQELFVDRLDLTASATAADRAASVAARAARRAARVAGAKPTRETTSRSKSHPKKERR